MASGWKPYLGNALTAAGLGSFVAFALLHWCSPQAPPTLKVAYWDVDLHYVLACIAPILGAAGFACHYSSRVTSAESHQSLLNTNALSNHLEIHNAPAASSDVSAEKTVAEFVQEIRQVMVDDTHHAVEAAIGWTRLHCHTTILMEITKRLAEKGRTLAAGINSETHPLRFRAKHCEQLRIFLRGVHEILSWQWFRTASRLHGNAIDRKYQSIKRASEFLGIHLSGLDELEKRTGIEDDDYKQVFDKVTTELMTLGKELDEINDECGTITSQISFPSVKTIDIIDVTRI